MDQRFPGVEGFDATLGIWFHVERPPGSDRGRAALFLDRDGVVVEEVDYLRRSEDVRLIPGAARTVARANELGIPVVIVTNQAGVGRGYFDWNQLAEVQQRIHADLAAEGATVDAVFACPYHPEAVAPFVHPDHPARKPNPGMVIRAAELLALDLAASWIVGDRASDLAAGRNAGLAGGLHVLTGYGQGEHKAVAEIADERFQVFSAESIGDAESHIPLLGR